MRLLRLNVHAFYLVLLLKCVTTENNSHIAWTWTCDYGQCIKVQYNPQEHTRPVPLAMCKMTCTADSLIWPLPTRHVTLSNSIVKVNMDNINVHIKNTGASDVLLKAAIERFKSMVSLNIPEGMKPKKVDTNMTIYLINENPAAINMPLDLDETYNLELSSNSNSMVYVNITASTFFGLRHGLETMSQLFVYDEYEQHLYVIEKADIKDGPAYQYRGLMLDTARNYYTVDAIKRTIDAMAMVKLNTFHWHITDTHSFPFVSEKRPELSKIGAYSPSKAYSKKLIREVVRYGLERGVRVMAELDAPAHVGEGWQDTKILLCFNTKEHWSELCTEPPCGHLDPTEQETYDYLEDIYADMADVFNTDVFHMGGDEVSERCWNSSERIQNFMLKRDWKLTRAGYRQLWSFFQYQAQQRAYKAFGKTLPLILWSSPMTDVEYIDDSINKEDYIIQVWTTAADPQLIGYLKKGFKIIISNYESLYLDCGFGDWMGEGNNWCSPYNGWKAVYDNDIYQLEQDYKDLILGAEAVLWSEQSDSATLDGRLWPRGAALAERLWSNPKFLSEQAGPRMAHIRSKLVRMGIQADSIIPEWCYQNENNC